MFSHRGIAAHILTLSLILTVGCDSSSSDITLATPLDGMLNPTIDSGTIVDGDLVQDGAVLDASATDSELGIDANNSTMPTADMGTTETDVAFADATTPVSDSMLPTPTCSERPERSCMDICTHLVDCLVGDGCLGIEDQDRASLMESCTQSCGFNTNTRRLLCASDMLACPSTLDTLYDSDETLNALCNFEDTFTQQQRDNCRNICQQSAACTRQMGLSTESAEACRFQCLSAGSYAAADCLSELTCDENFENAAQACLQDRMSYAPLLRTCEVLCGHLNACGSDAVSIFGGNDTMACVEACESQLTSAYSVACVGRLGCALSNEQVSQCGEAHRSSPGCELTCLSILECTQSENPFGVTPEVLQRCVSDCESSTTEAQRACSFDISCGENYATDLAACGME